MPCATKALIDQIVKGWQKRSSCLELNFTRAYWPKVTRRLCTERPCDGNFSDFRQLDCQSSRAWLPVRTHKEGLEPRRWLQTVSASQQRDRLCPLQIRRACFQSCWVVQQARCRISPKSVFSRSQCRQDWQRLLLVWFKQLERLHVRCEWLRQQNCAIRTMAWSKGARN